MQYPRLVADMNVVMPGGTKAEWSARMVELSPNSYAVGTIFKEEKCNAVKTCDYEAGIRILLKCWTFLHGIHNYVYIMKNAYNLLDDFPKILEIGEA